MIHTGFQRAPPAAAGRAADSEVNSPSGSISEKEPWPCGPRGPGLGSQQIRGGVAATSGFAEEGARTFPMVSSSGRGEGGDTGQSKGLPASLWVPLVGPWQRGPAARKRPLGQGMWTREGGEDFRVAREGCRCPTDCRLTSQGDRQERRVRKASGRGDDPGEGQSQGGEARQGDLLGEGSCVCTWVGHEGPWRTP